MTEAAALHEETGSRWRHSLATSRSSLPIAVFHGTCLAATLQNTCCLPRDLINNMLGSGES